MDASNTAALVTSALTIIGVLTGEKWQQGKTSWVKYDEITFNGVQMHF